MSVSPGSAFPAPPASGAQFKLLSRGIVKPARAREVAAGRGWRALAPPAGPRGTSPTFSLRWACQAGPGWQRALALSLVRAVIHIVRSFLHSQIFTICVPQRALFLAEQAIKMARVPQKTQLWKAGAENQVLNQGCLS